ncbi:putative gpi-anchored cell surface glyco protein [Eutypa lata UCREL1]|uniref:Putative gpi-anchored cell surface glyco protein n=1 Tax=Eutypa lata (strain UCR-EL1) TaxID=1287681 RepID=M7S708_EUTLA|nr:putative gpi-anchored cell surface glyco protein [Eutypa lata UCREL1]
MSEIGDSTKASSLSESTDETIQANKEEEEAAGDSTQKDNNNSNGNSNDDADTNYENQIPHNEAEQHSKMTIEDSTDSSGGIKMRPVETDEPAPEVPKVTPEDPQADTLKKVASEDATSTAFSQSLSQESQQQQISEPHPSSFQTTEPTENIRDTVAVAEDITSKHPTKLPDTIVAKESQPSKEKDKGDIEEQSLQGNQESLVIPPKSSRRKSVDPLRTDLTASKTPQSEVSDPLLDDDLMDELQSAEVQEARPMLVSKSPINPVFPGNNLSISKDADTKGPAHLVRTVSNPIRGPLLVPTDVSQSSARSVSAGGAAYLHNITRQPSSAGLLKKGGVGSSISQRIKALEKLSSTTVKDDGRPKTATPTSSFYTVQKGTIQQPSKPASLADRASSVTRGSPPRDESREHTPDTPEKQKRGRSGSMANRLTVFEGQGLIPPAPRGRPESIQVTARILRDNTQDSLSRPQSRRDPTEFGPVELKESPLIIDVRKSEPEPKSEAPAVDSPKETIMERRMSRDLNATPEDVDKKSRRPSLGIVKDFIKDRRASVISKSTDNLLNLGSPKTATRPPSSNSNYSNLVRRMSTSSRRSLSYDRDSNGNSMPLGSPSVISDNSGDDEKGNDKKSAKNRASRFMRRLSNSFAPSRKAVSANISPTLTEEPADEAAALPETQPSVSAYMGDVNVQFPDNLLWKRRSMCLDTSGWLILSAVQGAGVGGKDKAGIKRYHLSDFRAPYAPDVEVQELPNSVRLDLVEGSCLQIACEDRNGQVNALQSLQDAHRNHSSLGH